MSKNGTKFSLDCPFKVNQQNDRKKLIRHQLLRGFIRIRIRIWNADPGVQNHADADPQHCFHPLRSGTDTFFLAHMFWYSHILVPVCLVLPIQYRNRPYFGHRP